MMNRLFVSVALTAVMSSIQAAGIELPETLSGWTHYTNGSRGSLTEEMYINNDALQQMSPSDKAFPYGTQILLIEKSGSNDITRYILMRNEKGWGAKYPISLRNGEWEYQAFHGDRTPFAEHEDPVSRCLSCHLGAAANDYVFSADRVRSLLSREK